MSFFFFFSGELTENTQPWEGPRYIWCGGKHLFLSQKGWAIHLSLLVSWQLWRTDHTRTTILINLIAGPFCPPPSVSLLGDGKAFWARHLQDLETQLSCAVVTCCSGLCRTCASHFFPRNKALLWRVFFVVVFRERVAILKLICCIHFTTKKKGPVVCYLKIGMLYSSDLFPCLPLCQPTLFKFL